MSADRPLRVLAWPAFRKRAANPFTALLCDGLRGRGVEVDDWTIGRALWRNVDLWHLHHPDTVVYHRSYIWSTLGTALLWLLLVQARWRGIRILWTIHDLDSSDGLHPRLEAWFWRYFLPRLDGYVCLSETGRQLALARFPQLRPLPGFVIPHGHFLDAYPKETSRAAARARLDLPASATVLLSFGLIRPYKDIPQLIRAFLGQSGPNTILVIAGRPYDRIVEDEVRAACAGAERVRLYLRWIPFEEVQDFFVASDVVVLPYRRILNSGTLMLALSFARPALVPAKGALAEQRQRFGADWVRLYEGELETDDLRDAASWGKGTERAERPDLTGCDWQTLAERTEAAYHDLLDSDACQPTGPTGGPEPIAVGVRPTHPDGGLQASKPIIRSSQGPIRSPGPHPQPD